MARGGKRSLPAALDSEGQTSRSVLPYAKRSGKTRDRLRSSFLLFAVDRGISFRYGSDKWRESNLRFEEKPLMKRWTNSI